MLQRVINWEQWAGTPQSGTAGEQQWAGTPQSGTVGEDLYLIIAGQLISLSRSPVVELKSMWQPTESIVVPSHSVGATSLSFLFDSPHQVRPGGVKSKFLFDSADPSETSATAKVITASVLQPQEDIEVGSTAISKCVDEDDLELESPNWLHARLAKLESRGYSRTNDPRKT